MAGPLEAWKTRAFQASRGERRPGPSHSNRADPDLATLIGYLMKRADSGQLAALARCIDDGASPAPGER